MDVYSQLREALIENVTSDKVTLSSGLIWYRTDTKQLKIYDGTIIRTVSFGAGGGGGGALSWAPDDLGNSALAVTEFLQKVWQFASGLSQKVYTVVKVPNSYVAGDQIRMRVLGYSDTLGTALLSSVATLIRTGTDAFDSTTNQRTSTNVATALPGAKIPLLTTLDLTSGTGTVNSVAVAAGDLIKVELSRGTDTCPGDLRFIESSTEVLFS